MWVDRKGRQDPLDLPSRNYGPARVSPDGGRIVASIADRGRDRELWVSAVERPAWTRIATPQHDGGDWFPMWTPNSKRLVFANFGGGAPGLLWTTPDGTGQVEPLVTIDDNSFIDARSWVPDGSLLFTFGPVREPRIGSLPIVNDRPGAWKRLIERAGGVLAGPFSPDGDWIVTESEDAGQWSVFIERFPDLTDRRRISAVGGGQNAVWSPDGREVFYRRPSDRAMMSVRIQTTPTLSLAPPEKLFDAPNSVIANSREWDVAQNGRFLLILQPLVTGSRELVLVQNWTEELKRLMPAN